MRNKTRALIILSAILLALIALTVVSAIYNARETQKAAAEKEPPVLGRLSDPVYISYNCGGADSVSVFILEDGLWYCQEERDLPLRQDHLNKTAELISELTAVRRLEITEDLFHYGLDQPTYTLTAKDSNGKTFSLLIGDKAPDGRYYVMEPGEDAVYTIEKDLPARLGDSLYALSETEAYDLLYESNMQSIEITGSDGAVVYVVKETAADSAGGKEYVWLLCTADGLIPAEDYSTGEDGANAKTYIDAIIKAFERSFFFSCKDYDCTDAQLSNYGLINPMKVTVVYSPEDEDNELEERTLVFLFGNQFTETSEIYGDELFYYAMLEGSKAVNCMTARRVIPFSDALSALGRASVDTTVQSTSIGLNNTNTGT